MEPALHKDWVNPHSFEWYAQLAELTERYHYSWDSTISEPNGESAFTQEAAMMVPEQTVLDIGCGHGDYAKQWSPVASRMVGVDVTEGYIRKANQNCLPNTAFVLANTKDRLPFDDGEFDCAYNRRGPTSSYLDLKRVLRKGGRLLALHPGDRSGEELSEWLPGLYGRNSEGTPILDHFKKRLEHSGCHELEIESIRAIEYLHKPVDVIHMCCFGQQPAVIKWAATEWLDEIASVFEQYGTNQGLPITHNRYLVRAIF
nr:methyltransferase domain-containing protein [Paenibacillus pinihumi]